MKFNFKNIWVLVLVVILGISSYALGVCGISESCDYYQTLGEYSFSLFEPMLFYSTTSAPLALFVLFTKDSVFRKVLRFSAWWLPLSLVLIAITQTEGHAMMPLYGELTKESLALIMGSIFSIVGIAIIVRGEKTKSA